MNRKYVVQIGQISIMLMLIFSIMLGQITAQGPVGTSFTYQGQLSDSNGNAANGLFDFEFKLFDAPTNGTQVGSTVTQNGLEVNGGIFTTLLDFGAVFDGQARFLEIAVRANGGASFDLLSPRQPLNSVPYAIYSQNAASSDMLQGKPISATNPTNGQVLKWDGTAWVPAADVSGGNGTITGVVAGTGLTGGGTTGQVTVGLGVPYQLPQSCTTGQIAKWNGTQWNCAADDTASGGGTSSITGITAGVGLTGGGTTGNVSLSLADSGVTSAKIADGTVSLADLASNGCTTNQVMQYNGTAWACATPITGSNGTDHTHGGQTWVGNYGSYGLYLKNSSSGLGVQRGLYVEGDEQGIFGTSTATNANASGVHGYVTGDTAAGTSGYHQSTSGIGYGLKGQSTSSAGYGVYGYASAATGSTIGVYGESASATGYGGKFVNSSASGVGVHAESDLYAIWGQLNDDGGYGVYGYSSSATGATVGVAGTVWSASGVGGKFTNQNTSSTTAVILEANSGNDTEFKVLRNGNAYADGAFIGGGADFAEMLPAVTGLEPTDVLAVGKDGKLTRSTQAYQRTVVGVYSTKPAFLGGAYEGVDLDSKIPLAVVGIVPVKVSAENGAIEPGDLLVASSKPGHAMRAGDEAPNGTVIGKALEPLAKGTGVISILVMLQ